MSQTSTKALTEQALKQHDHIHPTYQANTLSPARQRSQSQSTWKTPEDIGVRRRSRNVSIAESVASKSPVRSRSMGMSIFRIVAGARAWHQKAKQNSARNSRPRIKLENTYRLEPKDELKFNPEKVETLLKDIMESRLNGTIYNATAAKRISVDLSAFIKTKVKCLGFPRYKFVVSVTIIEKLGQGIHDVSRCLWNADVDNFATYTYTNTSLVAIAYVHAVYFE